MSVSDGPDMSNGANPRPFPPGPGRPTGQPFDLRPMHALVAGAALSVIIAFISNAHIAWVLVAIACGVGAWFVHSRNTSWPPDVHAMLVRRRLAQPQTAGVPAASDPPIPFRPMTLGEIFSAAFRVVLKNWPTLLGFPVALLVGFVLILIVLVKIIAAVAFDADRSVISFTAESSDPFGTIITIFLVLLVIFGALAYVFDALLIGISVTATTRAVRGEPVLASATFREAWSRMGAVCRLTGAYYAIGFIPEVLFFGLVFMIPGALTSGFVLFLSPLWLILCLAMFVVGILLSLAPVVLIAERRGVVASFKRSAELVKVVWPRILAVHALWAVAIFPVMIVSLATGFSFVLYAASIGVMIAFLRALQVLIYTDVRMRQENFAAELHSDWESRAGFVAPPVQSPPAQTISETDAHPAPDGPPIDSERVNLTTPSVPEAEPQQTPPAKPEQVDDVRHRPTEAFDAPTESHPPSAPPDAAAPPVVVAPVTAVRAEPTTPPVGWAPGPEMNAGIPAGSPSPAPWQLPQNQNSWAPRPFAQNPGGGPVQYPGVLPGYPPMGPPPGSGPQRRNPFLIPLSILLVVVVAVAAVIVWQVASRSSDDGGGLASGQLTVEFPDVPDQSWQLSASTFGGDTRFVSPSRNMYLSPGALTDGDRVITLVHDETTDTKRVVGIDSSTGSTWISDDEVNGCSDQIVAGAFACFSDSQVLLFDTEQGRVRARLPVTSSVSQVAYNGQLIVTSGYISGGRQLTAFNRDRQLWTEQYVMPQGAPAGDSMAMTATKDLIAVSGGGTVLVVSSRDGEGLLSSAGSAEHGPLPDGSMVVTPATLTDGSPRYGPVVTVHPDGSQTTLRGAGFVSPQTSSRGEGSTVLADNTLIDANTGSDRVTVDAELTTSSALPVLTESHAVLSRPQSLIAVDPTTGAHQWNVSRGSVTYGEFDAVTDGKRVIGVDTDGLFAYDLATGSPVWTQQLPGADQSLLYPAGDHVITVNSSTITGFKGTGGPAGALGGATAKADSENQADNGEGSDKYVTKCGQPPTFTPESFRTESGGLVVTMKVTAVCPGGDILASPQTSITIREGQSLVASGIFDFSASPIGIPGSSTTSAAGAATVQLTFPPGSFYRLPDTLGSGTTGSSGSSGSSGGSNGGTTYVVECVQSGTSAAPDRLPAPTTQSPVSVAATAAGSVAPAEIEANAGDALRRQANADRSFILANLNNRWVAQLSSKRPGLVADGRTWTNQAILDEFLSFRLRFSDARLLWSDEWSVFNYTGWWVTVATVTFPGPAEANNWCAQQGLDGDHCFAKLISTTHSAEGSTVYRR